MSKKTLIISISVIAVILIAVIAVFVVKMLPTEEEKEVDDIKSEYKPSACKLSTSEITKIANKLKSGFYGGLWGWTEDEELIYNAFNLIPTYEDLCAVRVKFGVHKDKTLDQHVYDLLSQSEIDKINNILSSNGIDFKY